MEGVASVEAEDGEAAESGRTAKVTGAGDAARSAAGGAEAAHEAAPGQPDHADDAGAEGSGDPAGSTDADTDADADTPARGRPLPEVSGGIGCAALLLPLVAVVGALLSFFAGVLSTATGCAPNGSALCSPNGPWYAFALPVFVSPLAAAVAAIGAVMVRRHRSTWLAVGYGIVFISIIVGLATASTGSS